MSDNQKNNRKSSENNTRVSKKRKLLIALTIVIFVLIGYTLYTEYFSVDDIGDPKAKTSTKPAVFPTAENLMNEMKRFGAYQELYNCVMSDENWQYHTYVIPGLNGTKTLNLHNGQVDLCEDMVPQGLAVTENYIIFTMYCHNEDHNSMLMVIDKNTGDFVKEVPLQGRPHAGGLAYDKKHSMLWISGKKNSVPTAIGIKLDDVIGYDSKDMFAPIDYKYEVELPGLKANSFMTFSYDTLFAGYFNLTNNGVIHLYPANKKGGLICNDKPANWWDVFVRDCILTPLSKFATVMPRIQGISFVNNNLLMTQSFGPFNSTLMLSDDTDITNGTNKLMHKNIVDETTFPPYLEYAYYSEDDGRVYFLFESGANAYRWRSRLPVDRIISYPID